jgi:hypothetical protein
VLRCRSSSREEAFEVETLRALTGIGLSSDGDDSAAEVRLSPDALVIARQMASSSGDLYRYTGGKNHEHIIIGN